MLTDIKRGYEEITDECFKFMERSTRTTGYYNGNGDLVKERPMEAQEMQKRSSRTLNLLVRRDKP